VVRPLGICAGAARVAASSGGLGTLPVLLQNDNQVRPRRQAM
jgi:hypothetical protein